MSDENKTPVTDQDEEKKDDELDLDDEDIDELDLDDEDDSEDHSEDDSEDDSDGEGDEEQDNGDDPNSALNIQRKKWRQRALKAEQALADLEKTKKQVKTPQKKSDDPFKQERMDFRFDHPLLTTREVDEIEAVAKAKGVSLEQAMRSPIVKIFLKASERKREHAKASPETRHRAAPKMKEKDPMKMSPEEFAAYKRQVKQGAFKK